jgi:predicted ATPase
MMRIRRLELTNFRTFGHAVFEDIPDTVLLVSPNGRGKSSVLEAIAGAHDLVIPYHQDRYPFMMQWQQRQVAVCLEVEATGKDCEYLSSANISNTKGSAHFVIEDGRHITTQQSDDTIKRLFQYHSPTEGVGFIDYIRPIRFYRNRQVGDFASELTDERFRKTLSEFHQEHHQHEKFSSFKSFVVSSQLNDFSTFQSSGVNTDSLEVFRKVFDHFFAPKRFVGYRTAQPTGKPQIVVESPFGSHDTDALSDGEKEVLHILAHLFRMRSLSNVVLWDTPELHLNAALESRLFDAIRRVAPNNQYWIATHSLELINSVPLESVFVIRQDGTSAAIERASGEDRKSRIAIYRDMGAQVGLQLVSAVVVFVEGKDANSDKRILDQLVAPFVPGVNFVAGGSCETIFAAGTRANYLLEEASTNGDFFAVVDRDYRDDSEVEDLVRRYKGRMFVWDCHEKENLFLDPNILHPTLVFLGHAAVGETPESVRNSLKDTAAALKDWIAADWVAWEFDKAFQPPSRRIGGENPKGSLEKYAASLKEKVEKATEIASLEARYEEKRVLIQSLLDQEQWLRRLPGKEMLRKYLERYPTLRPDDYMRAAASLIREREISVPELERLRSTLQQIPGATAK